MGFSLSPLGLPSLHLLPPRFRVGEIKWILLLNKRDLFCLFPCRCLCLPGHDEHCSHTMLHSPGLPQEEGGSCPKELKCGSASDCQNHRATEAGNDL